MTQVVYVTTMVIKILLNLFGVCSRAIGMESEEISDSKITGGKPLIHENKMVLKKHKLVLEDPRYKPHHARLTGDRDKKEVFRVPMEPFVENSDERWNDYNPAPFLSMPSIILCHLLAFRVFCL